MKAMRQNTKASVFHVYYKGCHEKVWPRFRVSLQTSNDSIKKTALQVGPDTWVFNYLFLVVNWPRPENNYKSSWQPRTAITLPTLKEDSEQKRDLQHGTGAEGQSYKLRISSRHQELGRGKTWGKGILPSTPIDLLTSRLIWKLISVTTSYPIVIPCSVQ